MTKKTGKPAGTKTTKQTDAKGRQTVTAKKQRVFGKKGTFNLMAGSRKEAVAQVAAKSGRTAALAKAEALGLKASSARSWLAQWVRLGHLSEDNARKVIRERHEQRLAAKAGAKSADPAKLRETAEQMRTAIATQAVTDEKVAAG